MEKVFSKQKYAESLLTCGYSKEDIEPCYDLWVNECAGLTAAAMNKLEYTPNSTWTLAPSLCANCGSKLPSWQTCANSVGGFTLAGFKQLPASVVSIKACEEATAKAIAQETIKDILVKIDENEIKGDDTMNDKLFTNYIYIPDYIAQVQSITINEVKKTTTVVFNDHKYEPVFTDAYTIINGVKKPVKKQIGFNIVRKDVRMAKCAEDDIYDRYKGVAVIIAATVYGSKSKLIKRAKDICAEPEQVALLCMIDKFGSLDKFKKFVDDKATIIVK